MKQATRRAQQPPRDTSRQYFLIKEHGMFPKRWAWVSDWVVDRDYFITMNDLLMTGNGRIRWGRYMWDTRRPGINPDTEISTLIFSPAEKRSPLPLCSTHSSLHPKTKKNPGLVLWRHAGASRYSVHSSQQHRILSGNSVGSSDVFS
jgi:hypothetical protein